MKQKKAIYVTLTLFALTMIVNQLIWYGWSPIFQGYGGLILSGGLAFILLIVLLIQLMAFWASRKNNKK